MLLIRNIKLSEGGLRGNVQYCLLLLSQLVHIFNLACDCDLFRSQDTKSFLG